MLDMLNLVFMVTPEGDCGNRFLPSFISCSFNDYVLIVISILDILNSDLGH